MEGVEKLKKVLMQGQKKKNEISVIMSLAFTFYLCVLLEENLSPRKTRLMLRMTETLVAMVGLISPKSVIDGFDSRLVPVVLWHCEDVEDE